MIEQTKISTLQNRYGLNSKQAVYDRINGLSIIPVVKGFVSSEQLDLLDKLDKHIRVGGAIADFPKVPEVDPPTLERINQADPAQLDLPSIVYKLIEVIGTQNQTRSIPLDKYRQLEEVIANNWILPTSAIQQIAQFKPRGRDATHGSFHFLRVGKIGKEAAWKVSKLGAAADATKLDNQSH